MREAGPQQTSWLVKALPALTFLLGLLIGGVVVGVGLRSDDPSAGEDSTAEPGSPSADTSATPSDGAGSDTAVTVPAACTGAAEKVTRAVELLRSGAAAIRDFQPGELTDVLNELEDLDPQLQQLAKDCSAVDVQPGTSSS